MQIIYLFFFLPIVSCICPRRTNKPKYVKYYKGSKDTNIVLSVPHDGCLKPDNIPDRTQGCYNSVTQKCDWRHDCVANGGAKVSGKCKVVLLADTRSSDLALQIRKNLTLLLGSKPHMVVSLLHRSKLDPNRNREDAAQFSPHAEAAFDAFHKKIEKARSKIKGAGLQLDIHGYRSHAVDDWIEFGYRISTIDLNSDNLDPNISSIRALATRMAKTGVTFEELLRGGNSLGGLTQKQVYRTVPSPRYPRPSIGADEGREGRYFRGGYITQKYGSSLGGQIDCIQIEFPQWTRDESAIHGPKLATAIAQFMEKYYPS